MEPCGNDGRAIFKAMKRIGNTLILFLFFLLFYTQMARAQASLQGYVRTADHQPLALVSVALLRDSNFIAGAVTDESGHFRITMAAMKPMGYTLQLSLVGYQTLSAPFIYPDTVFMAQLVLTPRKNILGEVTVTARKPLVTRKADRYIVNVENSYLADGNSGLDVLRKSPGLWVNANGSIRLKGSQPVTVMINDVVQRMSETELADYLRTLKSEDISKIEVIPNPPSEYEASSTGGIVHIILKKARKDGLTGSVYGQYRQQSTKPVASLGSSFDFKWGKLYSFGSYSYTIERSIYNGYTDISYPDKSRFYSPVNRDNNNSRHQYRFGMAYDFSPRHSITLQTVGSAGALLQHFYSDIYYNTPGKLTTGYANTDWVRHPLVNSTTLNYGWKIDSIGSSLKMIADYTSSSKTESNTLVSAYSDTAKNAYSRTNTPSTTGIYSIQADYTKALTDKMALKTGLKYVFTKRHNTVIADNYDGGSWIINPAAGNDFLYNEKLLMGYASFEKTMGQTSVKAGVRGEQTYSRGHSLTSNESIDKDYFGLFPSLFINHTIHEKKGNSVHLNYSRRVRRPGYNDLNPYRLQVHDYTILTGNPNLLPQYTHSIQAGYTLRNNYTADVYFMSTHNFITQTARTVDSNIIEYQSKNFPNSTEYGISFNGATTIGKIWSINNGFSLYRVSSQLNPTLTQTAFSIKTSQSITWKKIADFDVYAEYNSPYLNANSRQSSVLYTEMGATRKILKDRARLRLNVADPFNIVREKNVTGYNNTHILFYQKRPTRTYSIGFNYNFKAGKTFTKKKIDTNNSDEKSRL